MRDIGVTGVQTCALPILVAALPLDSVRQTLRLADRDIAHSAGKDSIEIGRASGRGRGEISVVAGSLKKKKKAHIGAWRTGRRRTEASRKTTTTSGDAP